MRRMTTSMVGGSIFGMLLLLAAGCGSNVSFEEVPRSDSQVVIEIQGMT